MSHNLKLRAHTNITTDTELIIIFKNRRNKQKQQHAHHHCRCFRFRRAHRSTANCALAVIRQCQLARCQVIFAHFSGEGVKLCTPLLQACVRLGARVITYRHHLTLLPLALTLEDSPLAMATPLASSVHCSDSTRSTNTSSGGVEGITSNGKFVDIGGNASGYSDSNSSRRRCRFNASAGEFARSTLPVAITCVLSPDCIPLEFQTSYALGSLLAMTSLTIRRAVRSP
jgi:hypothetical protein